MSIVDAASREEKGLGKGRREGIVEGRQFCPGTRIPLRYIRVELLRTPFAELDRDGTV
jgi:hypothetical protein